MRKRGSHIKRKAKTPPGIVAQSVHVEFEIRLRQAAVAFSDGWAQPGHFNDLVDTLDLLQIGLGSYSGQAPAPSMCNLVDVARDALDAIRARHIADGAVTATPGESLVLSLLASSSIDYWNRRSGALYAHAYIELQRIRERQAAEQGQEAACPTP